MLTTIFIILLILSQLLCFYIIALLNAKVAKFKDLEIHQEQLMREMEESISLYLVEIREENDRLIKELSENKTSNHVRKNESLAINDVEEQKIIVKKESTDANEPAIEQKVFVPKVIARNAYNQYKNQTTKAASEDHENTSKSEDKHEQLSFEQQVIKLNNEGKNIEEIAKLTNKGKTEIELLLKFQA
ncbi:hypothetical protein [Ureibacillus manganicus]|uniref:Swarming motility protein SwrB n=1 Tax=Ureibacillus manganicus DSM 26584 TaxID=1384049 RepID=A0A0A3IC04_9BACL|nr:hypothetical protein [Ureibacillus manganicus]KGR80328.1 hypothetical protein CD29_00095 [Ureibacillus manganicus DSM 26584]